MLPLLGTNPSLNLNLALQGRVFRHVNGVTGSDASRRAPNRAYRTIQGAIDAASAGDAILITPPGAGAAYDETVTIPRTLSNLVLIGIGGRGGVFIDPSTEDADGVICHADDVAFYNIGCAAEDSSAGNVALQVTGSRFRAYGCKLEQGATQLVLGPGTVAQEAAGTHGTGSDALFEDCEFCWGTNGVVLTASDYGAVTQAKFKDCEFHNLTAASFEETGGTVSIRFFDLLIDQCVFGDLDDGTAPTKWISLNDDNANAGVVSRCVFPTAINSGKNLCSTALHWIGNLHTGGIAAAQPS